MKRIIISGGGTGGHIFPAISIADALKAMDPAVDILFVGARDRMEMEKVPAAGYQIRGLPIAGFHRKQIWKNLWVLIKLIRSLWLANVIIRLYKPHVVVGVGGYASGPVLWQALAKKIPTLIQEQNSYAGITNRLLSKKVNRICVAYEGMDKYFPAEKILVTGNPVRDEIENFRRSKKEAVEFYQLSPDRPIIFVLGGSLGSRTINEAILAGVGRLGEEGIQLLWQTGKTYYDEMMRRAGARKGVVIRPFIGNMDLAYSAADLVVSRAGAGTISEICLVGLPGVFVPSPNVAEDHQTRNAMTLVEKDAAILVPDEQAREELVPACIRLVQDKDACKRLSKNICSMAKPGAAEKIAREIFNLIKT